jgi:hypothetical protein
MVVNERKFRELHESDAFLARVDFLIWAYLSRALTISESVKKIRL